MIEYEGITYKVGDLLVDIAGYIYVVVAIEVSLLSSSRVHNIGDFHRTDGSLSLLGVIEFAERQRGQLRIISEWDLSHEWIRKLWNIEYLHKYIMLKRKIVRIRLRAPRHKKKPFTLVKSYGISIWPRAATRYYSMSEHKSGALFFSYRWFNFLVTVDLIF